MWQIKSEVEESSNSSPQDLDNLEAGNESVPGEDQIPNDDLISGNLEAGNSETTNNNGYNDHSSIETANEGSKGSDLLSILNLLIMNFEKFF